MAGCLSRAMLAGALACAISLSTSGFSSAQQTGQAAAPMGGINIGSVGPGESFAEIDREIAIARSLHAKLVRTNLLWSSFEASGPGRVSRAAAIAVGRLMKDAAAAHIGVIALVDSTPCWASSAPASVLSSCNE